MVARLDPPPELLTVVVVALIVVDPNTVAGAMRSVAQLGVFMTTIHAMGGLGMMESAVKAAADTASQCTFSHSTARGGSDVEASSTALAMVLRGASLVPGAPSLPSPVGAHHPVPSAAPVPPATAVPLAPPDEAGGVTGGLGGPGGVGAAGGEVAGLVVAGFDLESGGFGSGGAFFSNANQLGDFGFHSQALLVGSLFCSLGTAPADGQIIKGFGGAVYSGFEKCVHVHVP